MLQELHLARMGLEWIEDGAFCGLHEMSTLNLDHNKLTSLPEMCALKCCLIALHITNNNISGLRKDFLKGFEKLETLNLNYNNLLVLPDLHWIQHSMYVMSASWNKIQSLSAFDTSSIYQRLTDIDLSHNAIRTFNISLLRYTPKLSHFDLSGNKLNHIDDFRGLYESYINLKNNPWHCSLELSWMGEESLDFQPGLICETPTCLHGLPIAEMSK